MSLNPEDSLLAVLMAHNATYWQVAEIVCADDFSESGRRIFRAIADAVRAGEPADVVTLDDKLGGEVGRDAMSIASHAMGTAANVLTYARLVAERGEAHRLKGAGRQIAAAKTYDDAQAILAAVRPLQASRMKSAKDGLGEMVEALQRRYDANGSVSGSPTGIASLDELTSGWQAGNLVVVAARPGMGKTAFALESAVSAGRSLFFSLEMTAGELMERAVSNLGRLPHRWLRFPKDAPEHALGQITEASRTVAALPIILDDSTGLTVDAICSRARQAHMESPCNLIIVDHLGLVSREGKHDPSELGAITSQLKRLAKQLNTTVMLCCQLNRGLEARVDKRPQLSDLRDSGRIEEDADVVIALYRDEYYNPAGPLVGYAEFIIRKNRSGEQGTAWAKSLLSQMRFESADAPERPTSGPGGNADSGGFASRHRSGGQSEAMARISGDT